MKGLATYIENTLGISLNLNPFHKNETSKLPMYLNQAYRWHKAELMGKLCVMAEIDDNSFTVAQIEKHFAQVRNTMGLPVIGLFKQLEAYNRKRLIEKKIAFIVPDKQLYIPDFMMDLKEYRAVTRKKETLEPTAQLLLLYHILNKHEDKQPETKTFKELAILLDTNPMGITRAVDNLKYHDLIEVTGDKEKRIRFILAAGELWQEAEKRHLLINPVLKIVYVDEIPKGVNLLYSNASALPEYSNMNPSRQEYYAIEKSIFYGLQKSNALLNANAYEGMYCLEVWKYNPNILTQNTSAVDPLSLYLGLMDNPDERIEMALTHIIEEFTW